MARYTSDSGKAPHSPSTRTHLLLREKAFYILELCGHGYCVECLYKYLQQELSKMEGNEGLNNAEAQASEDKELNLSTEGEKGKEKEAYGGQARRDENATNDGTTRADAKRDITCPLASCRCIVSLDDLKKGHAALRSLSLPFP